VFQVVAKFDYFVIRNHYSVIGNYYSVIENHYSGNHRSFEAVIKVAIKVAIEAVIEAKSLDLLQNFATSVEHFLYYLLLMIQSRLELELLQHYLVVVNFTTMVSYLLDIVK
jgi:hypothetical protein